MEFYNLIGKTFKFYGVDGYCFKLGKTVWEAIENPDDGYRSYLDSIVQKYSRSDFLSQSLGYCQSY